MILLFLLLAGALTAYAFWIYGRAEVPVRGARVLAAIRAASLILILALLFDPPIPVSRSARSDDRWVLLDESLSMGAGGGLAWGEARRRADSLVALGWRIVAFGGVRERDSIGASGIPDAPEGIGTRLSPALERAAESGIGRVIVLSDFRIDDAVEAAATLASMPARVAFEDVGTDVVNAGLAHFSVTDVPREGDTATAEVRIFAEDAPDSVALEVREEGRLVLTRSVATPARGRLAEATFRLPPARSDGRVRYTATVHAVGDGFPSDDEGVAYASVGSEDGGLVLVSLHPDWEPRALLAVLEEVTGLRVAGYLRVGANRFTPIGRAMQRGAPVDSASVRKAAQGAAILVVHGLDGRTDAWGRALPGASRRALLWPLDGAAAAGLGLRVGPVRDGEWYVSPEVPSSPLSADLAGLDLRDLPPLSGVLPLDATEGGSTPLQIQFRGSGPFVPALLLDRQEGLRRVVVLASGFWRWSAREDRGREAYRRLWSGVAGWLLEEGLDAATPEARPVRWVFSRGREVRWRIPGETGDTARLRLVADADTVLDTLLAAGPSVPVRTLPPGSYGYTVAGAGDASVTGRFDVESKTAEMLPVRWTPDTAGEQGAAPASPRATTGGPRPLHLFPWPYLAILALLCAEWVGRRRVGLR
ncbi:MAG: hypothetical protein LJF04_14530 [Gemmatimonadetes bacterium]|nr:hypothetical protein [Gemmatimonadota bacterium]